MTRFKIEKYYLTKFGVSPLNGRVTWINDYYIEVFLIITSKLDSVAAEVLNTLSLITRPLPFPHPRLLARAGRSPARWPQLGC